MQEIVVATPNLTIKKFNKLHTCSVLLIPRAIWNFCQLFTKCGLMCQLTSPRPVSV